MEQASPGSIMMALHVRELWKKYDLPGQQLTTQSRQAAHPFFRALTPGGEVSTPLTLSKFDMIVSGFQSKCSSQDNTLKV